MVTNFKNCPDNRQGYGAISNTDPTLTSVEQALDFVDNLQVRFSKEI